jgi:hypothetical protein
MAQTACQIAWSAGLSSAASCLREDEIAEREGPRSAVDAFFERGTKFSDEERVWLPALFRSVNPAG